MKKAFMLVVILCLGIASTAAFAQDRTTTGSIGGTITDANGGALPSATVTAKGPTGERTTTTNAQGVFAIENLIPGNYSVKVSLTGFQSDVAPNVTVYVGKQSTLDLKLQPGDVNATVEVTDTAAGIDQSSTAVGANLNDQLFNNIPVQRSVTSLFYLSPGVTDSGRGGNANPSISGGSALDNLYIADGVNITDSAFGGLGTFTRNFGTLGTGINTSFIKEVQVKTGGFEPQYGQSQGGIVNIITQSGGNAYHGAIYGYAKPQAFEAHRLQADDTRTNKFGRILHEENYDAGADIGGYVPGLKNNLFFFGSFNPTYRREIVRGAAGSGLETLLGSTLRRYQTLNYAFKLDYNINPSHQITFSIFGDPTKTNKAPFAYLNIDNTTANNTLDYGTRSTAIRYNGTLSPTWTLSASFSQGKNHFTEGGFDNFNGITDRTGQPRGDFRAVGYGFFEPTEGKTYRASFDTLKTVTINKWHLGTHNLGLGYTYQRAYYNGTRDRSGPHFTVPATNADGTPVTDLAGNVAQAIGQPLNAEWELLSPGSIQPGGSAECTLCPFMDIPGRGSRRVYLRQIRGEYGITSFKTRSNYNAAYAQDTWRVNRYVTALLGLRMEQERIIGNQLANGTRLAYSFTDQWAPRLGVTVDPLGHGKTKIYYNYGRFFEYLPLDLAERSLSTENDFRAGRFAPQFTTDAAGVRHVVINQFGTVNPIIDSTHLLTGAAGGTGARISTSSQSLVNPILPGTKLGFTDEHVIGFEQQLPRNFTLSIRYMDRRIKRIVEDAAVVSPEAADFFGQTYFIGNVNSKLDAAVNPIGFKFTPGGPIPSQCDPGLVNNAVTDSNGKVLGAICYAANGKNGQPAGDPGADGVPDGFPDPVHHYKALEIELNKRFSNNWQLLTNYRIASLRGNYEGHFRNDNGQTDPGISSLFDFTAGEFNLLGDQFSVGPLNTDRRFISNIYASYAFGENGFGRSLKGLNLGGGLHFESGTPISEFGAHPVYLNAGEIPLGGRGKLGRTPFYSRLDLHADYKYPISEKMRLVFVGDFFNVTNTTPVFQVDQFRDSSFGVQNPDFLQPRSANPQTYVGYRLPFSMRLGIRFEF